MKRILAAGEPIPVPDGTMVRPVVDPWYWQRISVGRASPDVSVAMGILPPGVVSAIHVHPVVDQITWVVAGQLTVKMKDGEHDDPYELEVPTRHGVRTEAGTFFQLHNRTTQPCEVLYIVSPAFLFEADETGSVIYNDAVVCGDRSWADLAQAAWRVPELGDRAMTIRCREASLGRVVR